METNNLKHPKHSKAEVNKLWENYLILRRTNDSNELNLRNQLIENYIGLLDFTADKMASNFPPSVLADDCRQAGYFGLLAAIEAFDTGKNVSFTRYASIRIRGSILDFVRSMDPLSRQTRAIQNKVQKTVKDLVVDLGRNPTDEEIAGKLELSYHDFSFLSHRVANSTSLSLFEIEDGESNLGLIDLIENNNASDPTRLLEKEEFFRDLMKGFNDKEIYVMTLYYREMLSLKEIGAVLDLSESRVSQIKSDVLIKLKKMLNDIKSRVD